MISGTVFILGRTPDLAFAELRYTFPDITFTRIHDRAIHTERIFEHPDQLINKLGGTTAITEIFASNVADATPVSLAQSFSKDPHISTFCISRLGVDPFPESLSAQIKKELSLLGISSRYIVNKKAEPLSAVIVKGQKVQEYIVITTETGLMLVKTVAVQNIPEWVKRDFDRPYADPKRGMLPPKVARMLVNIADTDKKQKKVLLDPFCGMGTVLGEALLSGFSVEGSDIVPKVVHHAEQNVKWIKDQYPEITGSMHIFESDAVHVNEKLPAESISAIVTEPFMGSTSFALEKEIDPEEIRNTVKGLEKLYIGCLKRWHTLLEPNGIVLMAFPSFHIKGREFFVKKVIDSCESFGYSITDGPWGYSRPQAVVERKFYLLRKK